MVYATTEPTEALLLGGYTAVLDAGELLQYGPTAEVFHRAAVAARGARLQRPADEPGRRPRPPRWACSWTAGPQLPLALPAARPTRSRSACAPARCACSGARATSRCPARSSWPRSRAPTPSCTSRPPVGELVAQLTGVHHFDLGAAITLYLDPAQAYVFDAAGELLRGAGLRARER